MKVIPFHLMTLAFVVTIGCQQKVDIKADRTAIEGILDSYVRSVENEDMKLYGKNIAHDTLMVNFGVFGDPIVGWEALEKVMASQNEALSQIEIVASDVSIRLSPMANFAWATSIWDFKAMMEGNPVVLPVRCSWILEKQEGRWIIIHFHKSLAAG